MAKKAKTNTLPDGAYYVPNKPGWGLFINTFGDVITFSMFTYTMGGEQCWINFIQREDGKFNGYKPSATGFMSQIQQFNNGEVIAEAELIPLAMIGHATLNVSIDSEAIASGFSPKPPATLTFDATVERLG